MLTKDKLQKSIANLPESFSIDELIDQLIFIEKVEEGIVESEAGKTVSNEDVKSMIDKWSSLYGQQYLLMIWRIFLILLLKILKDTLPLPQTKSIEAFKKLLKIHF